MSCIYKCAKECCLIEVIESKQFLFRKTRRGNCRKAGVFIFDPEQEKVLLVQSRGQLWGPPKGTLEIDKNETSCDCAIREVQEETGLMLTSDDFKRAIKIRNRAIYYYTERKAAPIHIQDIILDSDQVNDANGITWIKISCLKESINSGHIILNEHCRIAFKKFLNVEFPKTDFIKVRKKGRRKVKD